VGILLSVTTAALATPEYAERTRQGCLTCHSDPMAGVLAETGLEFAASGYVWPPAGGYRVIGPIQRHVRLVVGLVHIVAAFIWFGTILYVHLMLKPAYAEKGLPRGEVLLGLVSMGAVGLTGILLTISRVQGLDVLLASPWGIVLCIKIGLYLVMISSAGFTVAFIGPRLRAARAGVAAVPPDGVFDPACLAAFDGQDGRPAYIAHAGVVYDVTALKLWTGGKHTRHLAGTDLTAAIGKAPHGTEKLDPLKRVGTFDPALKPRKTFAQKAFHLVAYMNLGIVFLVLITIAYWRWGIG
jgi:predicted heme/steroid binding protein